MLDIVLAAGLILLAVAVMTLVRALSDASHAPEVLDQIGAYGFGAKPVEAEDDVQRRGSLGNFAASLGEHVSRRQSASRERDLRRRLIAAGWYSLSPRVFLGYQVIAAVAGLVVWVVGAGLLSANPPLFVVGIVVATLFGWYLPSIVLDRKVKERYHLIDRALPELIDLLVVTVEAGVGFVGALRLASLHLDGPLAQELRLTLQEQNMGLTSTEAIEGMLRRVDTPGTRSFVRAIVQSETLGVSIGQILRNLADEMRKRRKATAEEQAQKAPVKMLFPLVFLIFPAMFVVLLLPALISIVHTLNG